jgi:hypothetical protein
MLQWKLLLPEVSAGCGVIDHTLVDEDTRYIHIHTYYLILYAFAEITLSTNR